MSKARVVGSWAIAMIVALVAIVLLALYVPSTVLTVVRVTDYCPPGTSQCSGTTTFHQYPMNITWDSHVSLHWWVNVSGPTAEVTVTDPNGAVVYSESGSQGSGSFYVPHTTSHSPYTWSLTLTGSGSDPYYALVLFENQTVWGPPLF